MKRKTLFACLFFYCQMAFAQAQTDVVFLEKLMRQHADKFGKILADPSKYRVQILYTQIDRDRRNQPTFKSFSYRVNSAEYFYPASTVKFPACLLALEKLNRWKAAVVEIRFINKLF